MVASSCCASLGWKMVKATHVHCLLRVRALQHSGLTAVQSWVSAYQAWGLAHVNVDVDASGTERG